jgi:hypothetical protein
MQQQLMEEESQRINLRTQLDGEGQNREALQHQFSRSRGDIDSLQSLLQQSEASRAKQEQQLLAAEEVGTDEKCWPGRCCSPRHMLSFKSGNEGAKCVSVTWRSTDQARIARHVIESHFTHNASADVTSTVYESL